ncbi:hypothetical protein SNR37_003147 [Agarivorans aestuarii]|uniref:Uncharacterized protein n=1 Tax=Agarivorans aestuarii TaxID=1563703 RepID=A0ABU7G5K2_9ALTE|nr:hypothetical protein [Agarivorans aestuarii]MEE1673720.1 hypothetical protein [Agarivorans aestuarii]
MTDLQESFQTSSAEQTQLLILGAAIGGAKILKELEPALSDGTRHGSPLCGKALGELSQKREALNAIAMSSLEQLGITLPAMKANTPYLK